MGLEKEKSETKVLVDHIDGDDGGDLSRSMRPILGWNEKVSRVTEDRDPHGINTELQVGFPDIIGEPPGVRSFDAVWICSHAALELLKYSLYRLLTALLAVPVSFIAGLLFAVTSCINIWLITPLMRSCVMAMSPVKTVWSSWTLLFVEPFFRSTGRCLASLSVQAEDH
ncbi:caveolin-2-like [Paramormyrops kingsleyae]|uniref:caveolin-2-like n=1 Tax=Paramormyrops kingsleyae TaxID=1676925 RepID=UPI000CD638DA|nr:caveolin-2-like [Paramormyrops kingsleyae]